MKIPSTLKRFASKIADIDRDEDGWYFVYLADGWFCTATETHTISGDSLEACAGYFDSVIPCTCADCKKELGRVAESFKKPSGV